MAEACRPESAAEAAGIISSARQAGDRLFLCGGQTRTVPPIDGATTLNSGGITGIVDYEPAEMVMIARAGTPMHEIDAALDKNKQRLVFDPTDHRHLLGTSGEPTIGGVAAANVSGSRRFIAGAARDSLLGCRFVNGCGEQINAGGRVMKNVTGLDLVKLMAGSRGSLGLMTEVTFKVVPNVETEATLIIHGLDPTVAAEAMAAAMATTADVSGAAHIPAASASGIGHLEGDSTLLRLEGFAGAVAIRTETLRAALGGFGEMSLIEGDASGSIWNAIRDCTPFADGTADPVWRISMAPMNGARFALSFGEGDRFFDWQGGLVWLRLKGDPQIEKVRSTVAECGGGHASLVRASRDIITSSAALHPEPPAVAALNERIRRGFDPDAVFASAMNNNLQRGGL